VLVLDPERLFSAEISIIVLLMTVLGGSGTLWGPAKHRDARPQMVCLDYVGNG
jgi:hypothetical protein